MALIDTHCHAYVSAFDADRDAVLRQAFDAGVDRLLLHSKQVRTLSIDLIGNRDSLKDGLERGTGVFPSDHFGLSAKYGSGALEEATGGFPRSDSTSCSPTRVEERARDSGAPPTRAEASATRPKT